MLSRPLVSNSEAKRYVDNSCGRVSRKCFCVSLTKCNYYVCNCVSIVCVFVCVFVYVSCVCVMMLTRARLFFVNLGFK